MVILHIHNMHPVRSSLFHIYSFIIMYFQAMEALGVANYNKTPHGKDNDRISSEVFSQEAYDYFIFIIFSLNCFFIFL